MAERKEVAKKNDTKKLQRVNIKKEFSHTSGGGSSTVHLPGMFKFFVICTTGHIQENCLKVLA